MIVAYVGIRVVVKSNNYPKTLYPDQNRIEEGSSVKANNFLHLLMWPCGSAGAYKAWLVSP